MRHRSQTEAGLASTAAVTVAAVLLVAALVAGALGRLLVDARRAGAAADLAALAAAAAVQRQVPGCAAAQTVARQNGADLASCVTRGDVVVVTARVRSPGLLGRVVPVSATARAGPVGPLTG